MRRGPATARQAGASGWLEILDPLLVEAVVLLRAVSWDGLADWPNEGSAGGVAALVDDNPSAPVREANPYRADIALTDPEITDDEHGFEFPDIAAVELTASNDLSVTIVFTPDAVDTDGVKFLWKYAIASPTGLNEVNGLVMEHVDFGGGGNLLCAINSGNAQPSGVGAAGIAGRQAWTFRVDRGNDVCSVVRNGAVLPNAFAGDITETPISTVTDASNTALWYIGGGQDFESLVIHDRVLDDDETAELHALYGL